MLVLPGKETALPWLAILTRSSFVAPLECEQEYHQVNSLAQGLRLRDDFEDFACSAIMYHIFRLCPTDNESLEEIALTHCK